MKYNVGIMINNILIIISAFVSLSILMFVFVKRHGMNSKTNGLQPIKVKNKLN